MVKDKKLTDELKKTITELKGICKDSKFADALIHKILSIKGQMDVEPTLVNVPITGNEEVIDTGGCYKITRNSVATIFHINGFDFVVSKDGVDVVIKNRLRAAHTPFDTLFALYNEKNENGLEGEKLDLYEVLLSCTVAMFQAPVISSYKEKWQAELYMLVGEWLKELNNELSNTEEQEKSEK